MQIPLTVTFRNVPRSEALEAAARRGVDKLEHFGRITGCSATIEAPHHHRHSHRPFEARVRLLVPGGEIVVSHDAGGAGHADPYVALRRAFDAARRQLEDFVRHRRGDVKRHTLQADAR